MKRLFKKMIPIMALLIVSMTVLTCLYGCTGKNSNRFDTDLFCCMYNEDKTGVIILELTEKGQEQEILVIPEEINELPVVQLGGETWGYPYQSNHLLKSEKAKKVYFLFSIVYVQHKKIKFPNATVILNDVKKDPYKDQNAFYLTRDILCRQYVLDFAVNKEIIKNTQVDTESIDLCYEANVFFYVNGEIKYIDYIADGEIYMRPEEYDLSLNITGWFLDAECTMPWDGKYLIGEQTTLYLFGKENFN